MQQTADVDYKNFSDWPAALGLAAPDTKVNICYGILSHLAYLTSNSAHDCQS